MAGTIKLDGTTFLTKDSSNNFTLDVGSGGTISQGTIGDNVTFPANSILQHKHDLLTGLAEVNHQTTTETATAITASITPKEVGSKIHVIFNFFSGMIVNSSAGMTGTHRIKRTGNSVTDDFIGSVASYNIYFEAGVRTSNAQSMHPFTLSIVDTPGHTNTTDPITYTLFVKSGLAGSGTLAVRINKGGSGTANLTFLEIKQ